MTSPAYNIFGDESLPPQGEWRMPPYAYRSCEVEFLDLLSSLPSGGSSVNSSTSNLSRIGGNQAHVFKVRIAGQGEFALKVFKFYSQELLCELNFPYSNKRVSDDTMLFQSDPFFAECRAYAKIRHIEEELARKSKPRRLAVPCFGFMALSAAKHRPIFSETFKIKNWDGMSSRNEEQGRGDAPFRALVKELVVGKRAVMNPPRLLQDLKLLRSHGIYPMDIHVRNYLNSLLFDFGLAWTEPYWATRELNSTTLKQQKNSDLFDFNHMIESEFPRAVTRAIRDDHA